MNEKLIWMIIHQLKQFKYDEIKGLSDNENRELRGVLDPPSSIVSESRTGDNGALQLQAYYLQDTIDSSL